MIPRPLVLVLVLVLVLDLVLALAACNTGNRAEAERLVIAVDRYRRAENADKPTAASAIRALPCEDTDVCRARDACLASADPTSKALGLKAEVEKKLSALEKGTLAKDSAEATALPAKLDEAESLLKEGFERLPACDEQLQALKRKHGI
jgi:hypothetical protein